MRWKPRSGHIKDLPKSKLGVDLEGDFETEYTSSPEKKKSWPS